MHVLHANAKIFVLESINTKKKRKEKLREKNRRQNHKTEMISWIKGIKEFQICLVMRNWTEFFPSSQL